MKIVKFTTLLEGNKLNLLKPTQVTSSEVCFNVNKNLENNVEANLEFINNLSGKEHFFFKNLNKIKQDDIDLIEDIIGRKLLKSDFDNINKVNFNDNNEKNFIIIFLSNIYNLTGMGLEKNIIFKTFKDFLKKNYLEVINDKEIYNFFVKIGPEYVISIIHGIEIILDKKISEIEFDNNLIKSLNKIFNQFENILAINKIAEFFKGEIVIDDFRVETGKYSNRLTDFLSSFTDLGKNSGNSILLNNIDIIKNELNINVHFSDLKQIDSNWIFLFEEENFNELSKEIITFCYSKNIFSNIEEFLELNHRGLFRNVDDELFKKNYKYLEENFGRELIFEDFKDDYLPNFIKYADTDNFNFLIEEIKKSGGTNSDFNTLIKLFNSKDIKSNNDIEYLQIFSFILQPGLAEKIKYFYKKSGEEFEIFKYFNSFGKFHKHQDINNIAKNYNNSFDKFLEENNVKNIDEFKIGVDLLFKKFGNINYSLDIFYIIEKIVLLDKFGFDISFEELSNRKFVIFCRDIDIEILLFIFNTYKANIKNKEDLFFLNEYDKFYFEDLKYIIEEYKIEFNLLKSKYFIEFFNGGDYDILLEILKVFKTKKERNYIFSNNISLDEIERFFYIGNMDESNLEFFIKRLDKNYNNLKFIINNTSLNLEQILFNEISYGSNVFDKLKKDIEKNPEKNIYKIMNEKIEDEYEEIVGIKNKKYTDEEINKNQKRIIDYQKKFTSEENEVRGKELGIDKNKLDFSIYLRYGHTVDYPEIAEYIILFLEKYFREGNSKYFKNIRIVPRNKDGELLPNSDLMKNKNITACSVFGHSDFKLSLHKNAISLFLSHSSETNPYKLPYISSCTMNGGIKSKIELENEYEEKKDIDFKINEKELREILLEIVKNIKELEKELDKII